MTTTSHARPRPASRPAILPDGRPTHLRLVRSAEVSAASAVSRRSTTSTTATTATTSTTAGLPATEPPLRLTRRGRVVLRSLVLLLLVALLSAAGLALARRADAADPLAPVAYHVVLPGETLWGIASELDPSADPRDTIAELVKTNHLPSAAVGAGQRLVLPPGLPRHP